MNFLLDGFNAKVGREDIFKTTIGNEISHEISRDNGVTVVNLVVKSNMFLHRKIRKYSWTSPDGQKHNKFDHISTDRRRHSSILDVRSFRGADCGTDHYLVVAKIKERLAVSKRPVNKVDMDGFNLKELNEGVVTEQYQVTTKNRFSALENLEDYGDINKAWDAIREKIKCLPKNVSVIVKQSVMNHGLMRNV
jgi:hypothetical protein